eukprot:TRINITY_DN18629_c0_g1_i1.p1 TRINITY_DN18629_c0_g1~~TRINITY_DN18629_c0_g1_i1.p1  ORF type:complete len:202 (+),score=60.14 TRINITY_DN18629_c0_g1_i1:156-761(+)
MGCTWCGSNAGMDELLEENTGLLAEIRRLENARRKLEASVASEASKRRANESHHYCRVLQTEELKRHLDEDTRRMEGELEETRKALMKERASRKKWQEKAGRIETMGKMMLDKKAGEVLNKELEGIALHEKNKQLLSRIKELERKPFTRHHTGSCFLPDFETHFDNDDKEAIESMQLSAALLATTLPREPTPEPEHLQCCT